MKVPGLKITAQPLRFLNMLAEDPLVVEYRKMKIKVPRPEAYLFHKLMISQRRFKDQKRAKDFSAALELFNFLKEKGFVKHLKAYFSSLPRGGRMKITSVLRTSQQDEVLSALL